MSETDIPSEETVEMARDLMVGQLRDLVLDHLKAEKKSLPWNLWPETEQQAVIDRVTGSVINAVETAVAIIARDGRAAVPGQIEQIVIKDGLKIVVRATHTTENLLLVGGKGPCHLIFADPAAYSGAQERGPEPLQQDLELEDGEED